MQFSHGTKTLRSTKTYQQAIHLEVSVNVENLNNATDQSIK